MASQLSFETNSEWNAISQHLELFLENFFDFGIGALLIVTSVMERHSEGIRSIN